MIKYMDSKLICNIMLNEEKFKVFFRRYRIWEGCLFLVLVVNMVLVVIVGVLYKRRK